jgi:uncharacterized membrane protein YdbT with pleckstrin-like domain
MSSNDFDGLRIDRKAPEPGDLPTIQADYRRRQWRRMFSLAPAIIFVAIALHAPQWLILVTAVITGGAALYGNLQYRCPACAGHFGKRRVAGTCPHCGVRLEA